MGQQTTVALAAFVFCHVAVILSIIAVATPEWVETSSRTVNGSAATNMTCNKGLFKICYWNVDEKIDCSNLNETLQTGNFKATQGLYISATGCIGLAAIFYWIFLLSPSLNGSKLMATGIIIMEALSTILAFSALIVFGTSYSDAKDIPDTLEEKLGYSFWVATAGCIVSTVAIGCSGRHLQLIASRPVGYMDL